MNLTTKSGTVDLLAEIRALGARVEYEEGALRIHAPTGAIDAGLRARIAASKSDLIAEIVREMKGAASLPLSFLQERFWAHEALVDGGPIHRLRLAYRIVGEVDHARLVAAFDLVVARHPVVSMRIDDAGEAPCLRRRDDGGPPRLEVIAASPSMDVESQLEAFWAEPMSLINGPLFRARMIDFGLRDAILALDVHHIVWDGASSGIFIDELAAAYDDGGQPRTGRKTCDLTAIHASLEAAATAVEASSREYWGGRHFPPPAPLSTPIDRTRPAFFDSAGDWATIDFGRRTAAAARELALRERTTPFVVHLAAWGAFLAALVEVDELMLAVPASARGLAVAEDAIGCFVNVLYLPMRPMAGESVVDFVRAVRAETLGAISHVLARAEHVAVAEPRRDASRPPIAQAMFDFRETQRTKFADGASIEEIPINPRFSPYELTASVAEGEEGGRVEIQYPTALFSSGQAARIAAAYEAFLGAFVTSPEAQLSQLPLTSPATRTQLLDLARGAPSAGDDLACGGPLSTFDQIASERPAAPAILFEGRSTSYAELSDRVGAIAAALSQAGVGDGAIVAVMTARGPDAVASCLAAWRLGAAYLPLDPTYPADRLSFMASDSAAAAVVVDREEDAELLGAGRPRVVSLAGIDRPTTAPPALAYDPERRAYVIYTSGSTGRPKGVANSHGALANFLSSMRHEPGMSSGDVVLAVTTLSFDISILELFLPIVVGGCVAIASHETTTDPFALMDLLETSGATVMQATPATWRLLLDADWRGRPGLRALSGGESLTPALAAALFARVGEVWNMYGPTETTVWSTCKRIDEPDAISVGRPIAQTTLFVVDGAGRLRPPGTAGELLIGGAGVAIGYLGRNELTAERFIDGAGIDPAAGRLYRTGDLARWTPGGEIEILGRMDGQVKLRGHRIELGEIEAALDALPQVSKAVAAIRTDAGGEPALVAFLAYREGRTATGSELRRELRRTLPAYMVPQFFVEIDAPPMTNNGKIDRKALPGLADHAPPPRERTPPQSELEAAIAAVWRELLPVDDVAVTDNFFELGGQSLQAARMAAIVRQRTGRSISPRAAIFETLEQLARSSEAN